MNRNQRRLGRMHQKRSNDHESRRDRQERLDRQERAEQHERAEAQLKAERQERERIGRRHERFENRHDRATNRNERSEHVFERNESRMERAETQGKIFKEVEEVMSPKIKRNSRIDKFRTNKCCYVAPKQEDFGQLTDTEVAEDHTDKYQKMLKEQYGFDPLIPDTINQIKVLRKLLGENTRKETSSQYTSDKKLSAPEFPDPLNGSQWQNIDNADEIDKYLNHPKGQFDTCPMYFPENIHICDVPRIKIIAKKFSRFKKNNVELRKLDEKVVCVEYDVFVGDADKPGEELRAFFSIRPTYGKDQAYEQTNQIPAQVKNSFNISNEDLKKLNEKEIEIIDGKITENKTYLEDLKRILRRKQAINAKRNRNSLDLMSLYEMAKRESPPLDDQFSNVNFLSKAELQEMKELILRKCASSVQGISRRTVKKDLPTTGADINVISQSIMAELLRENATINE